MHPALLGPCFKTGVPLSYVRETHQRTPGGLRMATGTWEALGSGSSQDHHPLAEAEEPGPVPSLRTVTHVGSQPFP